MKTKAFWTVVALQAVFLLAWAGWHERVRSHGEVVRLKTRPVDPRDLLRGDYMILGYEIAVINASGVNANPVAQGEACWVVLEPRDGYHEAVSAGLARPDLQAGQIAVRATKSWRGFEYGIEHYYVPEGKGTPQFKKIEVEAAVGANHRLYIKRVLLDGKDYP
jgi:uncharacterized membrane-anchored protein